jgi:hypothetical protein
MEGKDGDTNSDVGVSQLPAVHDRDVALQIRANRGCHGVPLQTSAFQRVRSHIRELQWYVLEHS